MARSFPRPKALDLERGTTLSRGSRSRPSSEVLDLRREEGIIFGQVYLQLKWMALHVAKSTHDRGVRPRSGWRCCVQPSRLITEVLGLGRGSGIVFDQVLGREKSVEGGQVHS